MFEVSDWLADDSGAPATDMPSMRMVFCSEQTATGSRLTTVFRVGT